MRVASRYVSRLSCVLFVFVASCAGNPPATPEVDLSIEFESSVTNSALASITSLHLHASGDETYDHVTTLSRALQREEREVYEASAATRSVTLVLDALDANGDIVASGSVGPIAVVPRRRVGATLQLSAGLDGDMPIQLDGGSLDAKGSTYASEVLADSPIAYYRFGEASGAVAADSSGNGRPAKYNSMIGYGVTGAIANDPSTAISLEADDSWVQTENATPFSFSGNAPFTLEIWMNPPTVDSNYHLLFNWDDDASSGRQHYGMYVASSTGIVLERTVDGNTNNCEAALPAVGVWSHLVGTYDGTTLTLYVNGAVACTGNDTRSFTTDTNVLYIGNGGPGWHAILASFDEAAIYGTALSPARVLAHYMAAQ